MTELGSPLHLNMLTVKLRHSAMVGGLCRELAESLDWAPDDVDLAETTGYLHDIGSVDELCRTGLWKHREDHGQNGLHILIKSSLFDPFANYSTMWCAIRDHNKKETVDRDNALLLVLRDCDKLAIFNLVHSWGADAGENVDWLFEEAGYHEHLYGVMSGWLNELNYDWTRERMEACRIS